MLVCQSTLVAFLQPFRAFMHFIADLFKGCTPCDHARYPSCVLSVIQEMQSTAAFLDICLHFGYAASIPVQSIPGSPVFSNALMFPPGVTLASGGAGSFLLCQDKGGLHTK